MLANFHKDLLQPPGRTRRIAFIAGWLLATASVMLNSYVVGALGNSLPSFFLGLFWTCLNVYLFYTLFSRRLHDIGLSVGPFFVMIIITLFVLAFIAWVGGLSDYFAAVNENPEITQDAEASRILIEKYQADMKANMGWASWLASAPALLLSAFCAVKAGQPDDNKYGEPPHA